MICYKDMTFCVMSIDKLCSNTECGRYFTDKDHEEAMGWWFDKNYPLALADFSGECGIFKPVEIEE